MEIFRTKKNIRALECGMYSWFEALSSISLFLYVQELVNYNEQQVSDDKKVLLILENYLK